MSRSLYMIVSINLLPPLTVSLPNLKRESLIIPLYAYNFQAPQYLIKNFTSSLIR